MYYPNVPLLCLRCINIMIRKIYVKAIWAQRWRQEGRMVISWIMHL